tara:strand:- start:54 stop:254 length:201 start_codon:yes stop_codon:yes gene_type:complete
MCLLLFRTGFWVIVSTDITECVISPDSTLHTSNFIIIIHIIALLSGWLISKQNNPIVCKDYGDIMS